jgi:hypothetical protein
MIKVGQYPVVVPEIYIDIIQTVPRTDPTGDRNALTYSLVANNQYNINLPWDPTAPEWVEVYKDGTRIINSRIHTADGRTYAQMAGTIYEDFNVVGNVIQFSDRISGNIDIICDTSAAHWWGGAVIDCENIQIKATPTLLSNVYLPVENWPLVSGSQRGFDAQLKFKPGPIFELGKFPIKIFGTVPASFNVTLDGDERSSTSSTLVYSTSIQDDYVSDGVTNSFKLTKYPSSNNLIVYVEGDFVDQTTYNVANITLTNTISNTSTIVTELTFGNAFFASNVYANANVQINYVPPGASYNFSVMAEPGVIEGIATDFVTRRVESGLYAEPIVITQPVHGYARLSTDRRKIVYVPDVNFAGTDYFKWSMITQHGQIGDPICIEVTVTP